MCGILFAACILTDRQELIPDFVKKLESFEEANKLRGPDYSARYRTSIPLPDGQSRIELWFFSSVLGLRGNKITEQPIVSRSTGNVLCFNGEIFGGLEVDESQNDAAELARRLDETPISNVGRVLNSIDGPYALVYYHYASRHLFFSRDPLGRRSLLQNMVDNRQCDNLIITSVAGEMHGSDSFMEVPTEEIWTIPLAREAAGNGLSSIPSGQIECTSRRKRYTLSYSSLMVNSDDFLFRRVPRVSRHATPEPSTISTLSDFLPLEHPLSTIIDDFLTLLDNSVRTRIQALSRTIYKDNISSEGIASVAILFSGGIDSAIIAFLADRHIPKGEVIDLLNVAFENPRKMKPLKYNDRYREAHPTSDSEATTTLGYMVPDRVSGLEEVGELRLLCPGRTWNFVRVFDITSAGADNGKVEINVDFATSTSVRSKLSKLMQPCKTNMDLSLALALYFASEGKGTIRDTSTSVGVRYHSTARLLLNGLGSDELFGGYVRHRSAYLDGGWNALADELQLDLDRISTRNLGRDDRVVASHGKEMRHPFLASEVLNFVSCIPLNYKTDPRLPLGTGDKLLLRIGARRLGLVLASGRKKRAMQFGSHSARMESGVNEKKGHSTILVE